jgi:hypothetical protein
MIENLGTTKNKIIAIDEAIRLSVKTRPSEGMFWAQHESGDISGNEPQGEIEISRL